jgi:group I intron endonuclease
MVKVYIIENKISGSAYIGITEKSIDRRFTEHKRSMKNGIKTALYDAMRSYGVENFLLEEFCETEDRKSAGDIERHLIQIYKEHDSSYNLLRGGDGCGFYIPDKEAWKEKLKLARVGRTPALGMSHTEENKKLFSKVSNDYWDKQETYNFEQMDGLTHKEAKQKFGISTTHYYRLKNKRKLVDGNDIN